MYFFVFIAAAAACYFLFEAWQRPRAGVIVAAIAWLAYAVYEYFVANGVLCDANCNIRVDLLLIWPLVWIASLFGIYSPGKWTGTGKALAALSIVLVASIAAAFSYMMLVEQPAAEQLARCGAQAEAGPECETVAPPESTAAGAK